MWCEWLVVCAVLLPGGFGAANDDKVKWQVNYAGVLESITELKPTDTLTKGNATVYPRSAFRINLDSNSYAVGARRFSQTNGFTGRYCDSPDTQPQWPASSSEYSSSSRRQKQPQWAAWSSEYSSSPSHGDQAQWAAWSSEYSSSPSHREQPQWAAWSSEYSSSSTPGVRNSSPSHICLFKASNSVEVRSRCNGQVERVDKSNLIDIPVDGVWQQWSDWTQCSKSCGNGTRTRARECDGPQYGGKFCPGPTNETELCNTFECPGNLESLTESIFRLFRSVDSGSIMNQWLYTKDIML